MGPIGSKVKVIEVKSSRGSFFKRQGHRGQISVSRQSLVHFLKGQGHRGQRSNLCLFVFLFVPLLLPGPWADLHQTWSEG